MSAVDAAPGVAARGGSRPGRPLPVGPLLAAALLLVAFNLRAAVLALAPVLDPIREETGLSASAAGVLASVPLLCFGLFAFPAPHLARRFGMERTLTAAMLVLAAGIVLRLATPVVALFAGTALLGMAIAVCNVLVPGLIKRGFPERIGLMTGLYVTAMSIGGALAAATTAPLILATGMGWRPALALWAIPAVLAAVLWTPYLRGRHGQADPGEPQPVRSVWREPLAWQVATYMGLQSLSYYACSAWLPTLFIDHGMSSERAGMLLAVLNLVGIPVSLAVPIFAGRTRTQRCYAIVPLAIVATGLLGIVIAPTSAPVIWMVLIGGGQGATMSLALMFFGLRTSDGTQAAALSGMAQTVGYLLAATGPIVVGALHDLAGGWRVPFLVLTGLLIPQLLVGLGASRDVVVGAPRP